MWIVALCHTEMAEELAMLRAVVSSVVELMLGNSPNESFLVGIVDELAAKIWKQEEWCSRLEWPGTRVCDLILGLPSDRARLVGQLEELNRWLRVEQAAR
jgi:hypothetical protein